MFRGKAEKKVLAAGYDPARLPPGQYLTEKWPVLHAGSAAKYPDDLAGWDFTRHGRGRHTADADLGAAERAAAGRGDAGHPLRHALESVRRHRFEGIPWSALRELAGPRPSARFAIAHAEAGFTSNVPIEFLEREGAMLATHADGEPLSRDHGWPLRLIVPGKYFWKSAKWLRGIELTAERPSRLLGALRLPQRRRSVQGGAVRLLSQRENPSIEGWGTVPTGR